MESLYVYCRVVCETRLNMMTISREDEITNNPFELYRIFFLHLTNDLPVRKFVRITKN